MSVMLSIKPKWCDLIADGRKTIEVRKSRPKLETPFKCYIYCCKPKQVLRYVVNYEGGRTAFIKLPDGSSWYSSAVYSGQIIGDFICDMILPISIEYSDPKSSAAKNMIPYIGMTDKEMIDYLGNGKVGYGWHIADLRLYSYPKQLSEYGLSRAPQSWCYVRKRK